MLKEGVVKFDESLEKLLHVIDGKRPSVLPPARLDYTAELGKYQSAVHAALDYADTMRLAERIWGRDPTVWKNEPDHQAEIRIRLGWLDVAQKMRKSIPSSVIFGAEERDAQFKSVVLCGMGGSSLCVEVLNRTFGSAKAIHNSMSWIQQTRQR